MHVQNQLLEALEVDLPTRDPRSAEIASALKISMGRLDPWEIARRALTLAADAQTLIEEKEERIRRLESLSVTDELTSLLNRRGFRQAFRRSLDLAQRHGEEGVLCLIDLDEFKLVNDTLGHDAGDAVLCRVGEILRAFTRDSDLIARLGGDEFVALLVHAKASEAERRARQIHTELNRGNAVFAGAFIPVHASIGIVSYGPDTDGSDLLRAADQAMYRDKRGRAQDGLTHQS